MPERKPDPPATLHLRVTSSVRRRLRVACQALEISESEAARRALTNWLRENEPATDTADIKKGPRH